MYVYTCNSIIMYEIVFNIKKYFKAVMYVMYALFNIPITKIIQGILYITCQ